MECIFCKNEITESNLSVEHIIPRFLGGTYVLNNVCKKCNSEMGTDFEGELSNNPIIQFIQAFYLLKQRKSKKPIVPHLGLKINNMNVDCDNDGHIFFYSNPVITDDGDRKVNALVDKNMPQEKLDNMLDTKVSRLNKKNNREDLGYEIISETQKLEYGEIEEIEWGLDSRVIGQLFIKIAYEFASTALGQDYFNDKIASLFREAIKNGGNAFIPLEKYVYDIDCDKEMLQWCIDKVLEAIFANTEYNLCGGELIYPSDGNYIHEISLNYDCGALFVDISLFEIIKGCICVCEDVNNFGFEKGELIKLVMGISDDESFYKIYSNYDELENKFMYS